MQWNRLLSRVAMATVVLLVLAGCQSVSGGPVAAGDKTPQEWQAMARADLDATRALILSAHPGAIDELNPAFMQWTEEGYRQAQQLIPHVVSYDTALAAVRFYAAGFRDGHLAYSDNVRKSTYLIITSGWHVEETDGNYLVTGTLKNWPVALPPTGARLIECDGRAPATLIDEDVAPYYDRRALPGVRKDLAASMGWLLPSGARLKRCQFEIHAGKRVDYDLAYRPASMDEVFDMRPAPLQASDRSNRFSLADGVLWIRASNFNLQPGTPQGRELETMLSELPRLQGVRHIVFDTRNNGGGDSGVGDRIFEAVTGGLEYDRRDMERHPRTYAQRRVSDMLIESLSRYVDDATSVYGAQSEPVAFRSLALDQVRRAKAEGRPWVEQDETGFRLTRADIAARQGKLRNFSGTVAIVTDANCASACLDFADLVRSVPGAVHLGQETSADTVYMEAGYASLPSGNLFFLPTKVWRNRLRGNNETLIPDIPLRVNMKDDAAVYSATLAALKLPRP